MNPKFYNRDGSLTAYSFACGYVQKKEIAHYDVTLYLEGCWHIRTWDNEARKRIGWESFNRLGQARKAYKQEIRKAKEMTK
jgi:hypothetical protein